MNAKIKTYMPDLARLCEQFHVERLEIFGSALRDDFNPESSDFDFLATFKPLPLESKVDSYFGFKDALEVLLQRPVNVVVPKAIRNPYFREAVEKSKVLLYAARKNDDGMWLPEDHENEPRPHGLDVEQQAAAAPYRQTMSHEAFGLWATHPVDGLEYQERMREEWWTRHRPDRSEPCGGREK